MKKTLLTIGLATIAALSTQAQGYVVFSSSATTQSTNNVAGNQQVTGQAVASGKAAGAGNFYYALFWSSTGTGAGATQGTASLSTYAFNTAGWTMDADATAVAATGATPGRFAALAANSDGTTTVPGQTGGGTYYFTIIGWSANLGTTYSLAVANLTAAGQMGYFGQSAVSGPITVGNGAAIPAPTLMGASPNIPAFVLGSFNNVPEPGTLALAALGGASLLLFRRKK